MSRSSRKHAQRRMAARPRRWKAFWLELGKVAGGLVLVTIALMLSAVVAEYPVTDAVGAAEVIGAVVIGLAMLIGAFFLAGWGVLDVGEDLAIGWVGVLTGEVPQRFARGQPNAEKALAHAVTLIALLGFGAVTFLGGVKEVELQRAIEGLLLALAGLVYGLGPLIPRVIYWRRNANPTLDEPEEKNPRAAIFMILAVLGLGLAMGTDTIVWHLRADAGRVVLPYGDWFERFSLTDGPERVELELTPRRDGLTRIESYGCTVRDLRDADGRKVSLLDALEQKRRGVVAPDDSMVVRAFEARGGQRYEAWIPNEICTVRFRRHVGDKGATP